MKGRSTVRIGIGLLLGAFALASGSASAQVATEVGKYPTNPADVCVFLSAGACSSPFGRVNETFGIFYLSPNVAANSSAAGSLPRFRAALAKARNGDQNATIATMTDSTGFVVVGSVDTTQRARGWPAIMARQITQAIGQTAGAENVWGTWSTFGTYEGRASFTGGWTSGDGTVGGPTSVTSSAGTLTWRPAGSITVCDLYYVASTGLSFSWNYDGGSNTTVTPTATNQITKLSLAVAAGVHVLNLNWVAGTFRVIGADCYTSAVKQVSVWNWAWIGSHTAAWSASGQPWWPMEAVRFFSPDLIIVDLGLNDELSVSVSTYSANLQTIVDNIRTAGSDIVFKTFPPSQQSNKPNQQAYVNAFLAIAATNGIPVIDMFSRWGSYETQSQYGYYSDPVHLTFVGYAEEGAAVAAALLRLVY